MKNIYSKICFVILLSFVLIVFEQSCAKKPTVPANEMLSELIAMSESPGADWKFVKKKAYGIVKYYPEDPNARIIFALALEQCGQRNNALDQLKEAVKLDKENFFTNYSLGRLLLESDHPDEALGYLRTAENLRQGDENTVILLAKTTSLMGLYDESINCYARLFKAGRYCGKVEPLNEIALNLFRKGEYKKAESFLKHALKIDRNNPTIMLNLGILLDKYLDQPKTAKMAYQNYIQLTLRNSGLEKKRARISERMAELDKGI